MLPIPGPTAPVDRDADLGQGWLDRECFGQSAADKGPVRDYDRELLGARASRTMTKHQNMPCRQGSAQPLLAGLPGEPGGYGFAVVFGPSLGGGQVDRG